MTIYVPKQFLRLTYPENTDVGSCSDFYERRLKVVRVRDILHDPLTPREFLRRPMVNRGRWLIRARHIDRQCHRQFYLASSEEFHHEPDIKIGLFCNSRLVQTLEVFRPTKRERILAARYLKRCLIDDDDLSVGVYTDDLRLVG